MQHTALIFSTPNKRCVLLVCLMVFAGLLSNALAACGFLPTPGAAQPTAAPALQVFLLDPATLQRTQQRLPHDATLQASLQRLKHDAEHLLTRSPVSVVDKTQVPPSGDTHDYLSLSIYAWPDPTKPDGLPYIIHDGQVNPEVNSIPDKANLDEMISTVYTLAVAYYFTNTAAYATKAAEFLRVWFLDPQTAMNPNLNYAQVVRGKNTESPGGIIDAADLPLVMDAIGLLCSSSAWSAQDQHGMEGWVRQYLDWLLHSPSGQQEAQAVNNHSTWYDGQVSSLALFIGQKALATRVLQASAGRHIEGHIQADGGQPYELKRTKSWDYSVYNLQALFNLASLGNRVGIDLWHYQNAQGAGLQRAFEFVLPAALQQQSWPYPQIAPIQTSSLIPLLHLAALHYQQPSYIADEQTLEGDQAMTDRDNLLYGSGTSS